MDIVEDGAKHTVIFYNVKVPLTGELSFSAANAKCSANLKVKGESSLLLVELECPPRPVQTELYTRTVFIFIRSFSSCVTFKPASAPCGFLCPFVCICCGHRVVLLSNLEMNE